MFDTANKVKKAIIPAAGLGTRFLPATKAQPKEMLPIVDKPTIQYIVEEAVASGIEDIIIVTGRGKRAIEDHFDKSYELEEVLAKKQKWKPLKEVQEISDLANIHYIRQKEPLGLGHAILCARSFIGNDSFAVMLGDDIIQSPTPCLQQMMREYERCRASIVGVQEVPLEDVSKYGIIAPALSSINSHTTFPIAGLVEKPPADLAPSQLAIIGRYILTPEIFPILEDLKPGAGGEYQLTDAINIYNQYHPVYAYMFQGKRHDIGDKLGFIQAQIDYALERPELREELLRYMSSLIKATQKS
ncbi:UTP--glucose-1-phosphate uridylyltransferase GalU [Rossellomorea vietnamensis]|uniref:UTP--glucose-1-phosphate uridylyltransferase n=1 Tax=Rossellomorea vietnamensis TaxID=218284 RepID=A0A5D4K713_9BACI|nr:UTP--glucose-1-phosphate uridylyltransferase GalU [Rossellomorea vietnamensis]TYR72639.1 UTP--glucose-1-phosphate uridylyltransferase GalU [Rossellomorea vietnamensis]